MFIKYFSADFLVVHTKSRRMSVKDPTQSYACIVVNHRTYPTLPTLPAPVELS